MEILHLRNAYNIPGVGRKELVDNEVFTAAQKGQNIDLPKMMVDGRWWEVSAMYAQKWK